MNTNNLHNLFRFFFLLIFFSFLPLLNFSQEKNIKIKHDSTAKDSIHIIRADLIRGEGEDFNTIKLSGDAQFRQDSTYFYCDIALYKSNEKIVDAFGNIKVNQRDSLFLYGDTLFYNGNTKIAIIRGNVRLIKGDLTLSAPRLVYNMNTNTAYYSNGGTVVSKKNNNTLTSKKGYYYSDYNTLSFKDSVLLTNPEYVMKSDTLDYNENSEIAYFSGSTTITGENNLIFCKKGYYDTRNDISEFNRDAYLISDGHKIQGDKLYYDRNKGIGKAIGNMSLTDTTNKLIIAGDYGTRNEKTNTSFVTGNTMVSNWVDDDTLFLTADTIRVKKNKTTENNSIFAYQKVTFYKTDMQGTCDSLVYLQNDSSLRMFQNPILWSDKNQMDGDTIFIQLSNNKIKELNIRNNAFIIDNVLLINKILDSTNKDTTEINSKFDTTKTNYFNQIKGKTLKAVFIKDTLRNIYINGNGQSIYFTGEDFKPKEGLNKIICSNMVLKFKNNELVDIVFHKNPEGTLNNIADIKTEDQKLKGFHWEIEKRPENKHDLLKKSK